VAFAADYVVIVVWIAFVSTAGLVARSLLGIRLEAMTTDADKIQGHAVGFTALTLPVMLYFAAAEHFPWRGTPGKRLLGLQVLSVDGFATAPLTRLLVRSALKFAPWELAHTVVWHSPGQPFVTGPDGWGVAGYAVSLAVVVLYVVCLFVGSGRTPYDWAARTIVVYIR
jgi:uncharacterized RDD family membrane protein YckC